MKVLVCLFLLAAAGILLLSSCSYHDYYGMPGKKLASTLVPKSRKEYQWMDRHDLLVKKAQKAHAEIVFFGDSIFELMPEEILAGFFSKPSLTFGLSGDGTENMLWRLRNGELDFRQYKPRLIVLLIGTNNLSDWPGHRPSTSEEIALGVQANLQEIQKQLPDCKVLILGLLPRHESPNNEIRSELFDVNTRLSRLADGKRVWYLDTGAELLESDGTISPTIMPDFLHPSLAGYQIILSQVKKKLQEILPE